MLGNIEDVWTSYTGKGTTVAIIDDGFDYNHPEYRRSDGTSAILSTSRYYYSKNPDVYESTVYYKSYSSEPTCIAEDWEEVTEEEAQAGYEDAWATHGTNTSTTAAAPINNVGGVGIAPDADILALKIDFSFSAIRAAINYAVEQGVDVINMSLGAYSENFSDGFGDQQYGGSTTATFLNSACQSAYNAGIIVVAAAGNEATWHKSYPACNTKVIGVGALYQNSPTTLAPFTNYVSTSQTGEINVDILAPGYVYTAHQEGTQSNPTHTYNDTQGTSFASPIVAGAACLWKEKYPTGTPDEFLEQLQASASDIGVYTNKKIPISKYQGYNTDIGPSNITQGRLNVAGLLNIADPFVTPVQNNLSISVGEKKQIELQASNGTISYSSANTSVATVSNTGLVTGQGAGNTTITVTASNDGKTATATINVSVAAAVAATAISFSPDSVELTVGDTYNAEQTITVTPSNASRVFMFESQDTSVITVNEDTGLVTAVGVGDTTLYVVSIYGDAEAYLDVSVKANPLVSDTLTRATTGVTGTSYSSWSGKTGLSGAVYAGYSAGGNDSIQLRSNSNDSGIISTTSGGTISKVILAWNSSTSGRIVNVYGKNSAYSSPSDLFGSNKGTLLGTIDSDSATELTVSGSYSYVGICSSSGALYLDSVTFVWSTSGGTPTPPEPSKTLSSIAVSGSYKTTFQVDDTFSFGGTVTATFSDNSQAVVTSSCTFTGYDLSTAGNQTVTVSYTYSGTTKTTSYSITVQSSGGGQTSERTYTIGWGQASGTTGTYSNFTATSGSVTNILSFTSEKNGASSEPAYNANSEELRLYYSSQGNGGSITITPASKVTLTGFVMTTSTSPSVKYFVDGGSAKTVSYSSNAYTVTNISATSSLKIQNANTSNTQLRIETIALTYEVVDESDKIISSLSASYSGSDIYVGGTLDNSKVSVTASFTKPEKYTSESLDSSDYSLTGFSSASAGQKTITVTYTGSGNVANSPMTTTFTVNVINDNVKTVTVSNSRTYHPGETISKNDITVTLSFDSGKSETTSDFTFGNDGYQFTYEDTLSGGSSKQKQFSISYAGQTYNFNVNVSRVAYTEPSTSTKDITGTQGASAGITGTGNSGIKNYDSLTINGVTCAAENIYVYTSSSVKYFSFGKGIGCLYSTSPLSTPIKSFAINGRAGSARTDEKLYVSTDGSNWVLVSSADFVNNSYYYFKVACETTSTSYSNFNLRLTLAGQDNATNVANYIMYADTNGQCTSKLSLAVNKLNTMSNSNKNTFWTSNDYVIATARERLNAWATHEGKTISYSNNQFVLGSNQNSLNGLLNVNKDLTSQIILVVSLAGVSLLAVCFFLKRKKKNI